MDHHVAEKSLGITYTHLGIISHLREDYDKAVEYYLLSKKYAEKQQSDDLLVPLLHNLVIIMIDRGERGKARKYLDELNEIGRDIDNQYVRQEVQITTGYYLMGTRKLEDRIQAQTLFSQVVEGGSLDPYIRIFAIVNLCELLIDEYLWMKNQEKLEEIRTLCIELRKQSKSMGSFRMHFYSLILLSKLSVIDGNYKGAELILTQAQILLYEIGLHGLSQKLNGVYTHFFRNIGYLEESVNLEFIKGEAVKEINDILRGMLRHQDSKVSVSTSILNLMLFGVLFDGKIQFIHKFSNHKRKIENTEEIMKYLQNLEETQLKIERFRYQEQVVILIRDGDLHFFLIFHKNPEFPYMKLNVIIDLMQHSPLWRQFMSYLRSGTSIPDIFLVDLHGLIEQLFFHSSEMDPIDIEIPKSTSEEIKSLFHELKKYKKLIHPLTISILKCLDIHFSLGSQELREMIGMSSVQLSRELKKLKSMKIIESQLTFRDGVKYPVYFLTRQGESIMMKIIDLLQNLRR